MKKYTRRQKKQILANMFKFIFEVLGVFAVLALEYITIITYADIIQSIL